MGSLMGRRARPQPAMYSRYASSYNNRSRYRYPSYGYYDDNYYDYRNRNSWIDYYYGGDRYYPYYYDRDDYSRYRRRPRRPEPEPEVPRPEPPAEELTRALKVTNIELHVKENALKHHTSKYKCVIDDDQLVVRRGDTMKVTFTFDRPYDIDLNDAEIEVFMGKNASMGKGTKALMKLVETKTTDFDPEKWSASLVKKEGNDITINLFIPATAIIGRWNMTVKTKLDGKTTTGEDKLHIFNRECKQDLIVLFNAWCKDDTVNMDPPDNLTEYLLNDTGYLFSGSHNYPYARPWAFAQFHKGVLDASLYLLYAAYGGEPSQRMSNATEVTRMLSRMVNVNDEGGVLVGNWSGDYDDGTSPSKWAGSFPILDQYMKNKEPVKYGQCWVFSAVLTTVCRALGIPCRSVTNFGSAHDTDGSASIDIHTYANGEPIERMNADSVWNFHVWNEAWLRRDELEDHKLGWNVIDATPQELSDGLFMCGPCPVSAVKKGMCYVPYDTTFVFAEVNADQIYWVVDEKSGDMWIDDIDRRSVGLNMFTKNPHYDPEDDFSRKELKITSEYKFEEGSVAEREAILMAHKTSGIRKKIYNVPPKNAELNFELVLDKDAVLIGQQFSIAFKAKHIGENERTVHNPTIRVSPKLYTGRVGKPFVDMKYDDFVMKPNEEKTISVDLKVDDYIDYLVEGAHIFISATAVVPKIYGRPMQTVFKGQNFEFFKPTLRVKSDREGYIGKQMEFTISFENPLKKRLTNCGVTIESSGFDDQNDVKQKDIPALGKFETTFKLTPIASRALWHTVIFKFDCDELFDIFGQTWIRIVDDHDD